MEHSVTVYNPTTDRDQLTQKPGPGAQFCDDCGQWHVCAMNPHSDPCMAHVPLYDGSGNRTGERPCRQAATRGGSVCHKHGLGTRDKPGGRPIVHGRYSRTLPTGILARLEDGLHDPTLLSLRKEIALTDQAIEGLLSSIEPSDSGELILTQTQQFRLQSLIGTRRGLIGDEWKAMQRAQQVMSLQQINAIIAQLIDMLRRNLQGTTCPHCKEPIGDTFLRPVLEEIKNLVSSEKPKEPE